MDTNCNPQGIDYVIPSNDDAIRAIKLLVAKIADAAQLMLKKEKLRMKQKTNLYEGMYILSATLSDDARQKALDKIQAGITSRGGEILKVHAQGRKRLCYEIDGHREGYYYVMYFNSSPEAIGELWHEYHLNEDLVRFMTLRCEEVLEKIEFKPLIEQV